MTFPAVPSAHNLYATSSSLNSPGRGASTPSSQLGYTTMPTVMSHDALEEKRRRALREKERELAARQRQKELLAQKRENELKKKSEGDQLQRENGELRLDSIERENFEKEQKRIESIRNAEIRAEQGERKNEGGWYWLRKSVNRHCAWL